VRLELDALVFVQDMRRQELRHLRRVDALHVHADLTLLDQRKEPELVSVREIEVERGAAEQFRLSVAPADDAHVARSRSQALR
jgi:hypothetical protein